MTSIQSRSYLKETLAIKKRLESSFLELAERLKKIRDERLYESDYENFASFLWELDISEGMASKLIKVYDLYVLQYGIKAEKLAAVGWSNLYTLAKIATTKDKATELVEESALLRKSDIEDRVRSEVKPDCDHDWQEIHLKCCQKCNLRQKLYED